MFGLLRSAFYAFGLCLLFIAYNMDPLTTRLQDFLGLLHAPMFWRLHLVVTACLYAFHIAAYVGHSVQCRVPSGLATQALSRGKGITAEKNNS